GRGTGMRGQAFVGAGQWDSRPLRRSPRAALLRGLLDRRALENLAVISLDRGDEVVVGTERGVDLAFDLLGDLYVLVEERLGVVAALAEALVSVGEERPGLCHDVVLDPEVDQAPRRRDPPAELDVELGLAERRGDLVLHDLHADPVAD